MRSPARDGLVYLFGNLASAAVPFALLPLLTRWLAPDEFGLVVNFTILMAVSGALAGLSAHAAVGVEWFRREGKDRARFVGSAVLVVVASGALVAAACAAAVAVGGPQRLGFGADIAALAVVAAAANVLTLIRLALWQSAGHPWRHTALLVFSSALNVALSLLGVAALGWGGLGRVAGIAAAAVGVALLAVASMAVGGQMRVAPRRADVASLVAFGLPLAPHVLAAVVLANADRFTVGAVLGTEAVGRYGAAAQLAAVMAILGDAFVKAFNPWVYARLRAGTEADRLRVVQAIAAAVPGFAALAAAVLAVLLAAGTWILGPAYRDALEILPWLVAAGGLTGIYLAVSGLFFYAGLTGRLAGVTVASATVAALAALVLVPRFGVHGAGAANVLAQAVMALAAFVLAARSFDLPWSRVAGLRALARAPRDGPSSGHR